MEKKNRRIEQPEKDKAPLQRLGKHGVTIDYRVDENNELATRNGAIIFSFSAFVIAFAIVLGIWWLATGAINTWGLALALVIALLVILSVHIAQQWEKVVVLRLGRFSRVAGPGLFFTIPLIESCTMRIDQRMRTTTFGAEETLTADLVPLSVDAVLFWMVWDAKLACTEVLNFNKSVKLAAQTALREAIGRAGAAEVAIRRNQLDHELKSVLEEKVAPWGVTILSVEVRDILVPRDLHDVMSQEAQAEQRKKARIILMEAEADIADLLVEMDQTYMQHDGAFKLRMMHLLYESVKDTGGTVVIPNSLADAFKDISPDIDSLGKLAGR